MAQEIELKLEVAPQGVYSIMRPDWLGQTIGPDTKHTHLVSVYFDTPRFKLRDHGLSLRVRHVGDRRLQTIKLLSSNGAAFGRDEWEAEIDRGRPDLRLAKHTALAPLAKRKLRRDLRPIFTTTVDRTTVPVQTADAELELALDQGRIVANGRIEPINEIEVELKSGDPAALAGFAERLTRLLPVTYGPRSKAERGYALSAGEATSSIRGASVQLDRRMKTGEALRIIGLSCLHHALSNANAIRAGDAEGVHQMRVGLRRLRAAISLFKNVAGGTETDAIKTELKWLTGELGQARDMHVLLEDRVRPLRQSQTSGEGIAALKADIGAREFAGMSRVMAVIDGDRYRLLGIRTALWLANGQWARAEGQKIVALRETPIADFAAKVLDRRWRKITRKARKPGELHAASRHKLRIAVKKLRYASEFFASVFNRESKTARRYHKGLKTLQSGLGQLNDMEVHKRVASSMAHPSPLTRNSAGEALAMGFISGQEQMTVPSYIKKLQSVALKLRNTPGFWR